MRKGIIGLPLESPERKASGKSGSCIGGEGALRVCRASEDTLHNFPPVTLPKIENFVSIASFCYENQAAFAFLNEIQTLYV